MYKTNNALHKSPLTCLSYDLYSVFENEKALKKVEENSRNFQGLAQKFEDFSRKNGIYGLFKDSP